MNEDENTVYLNAPSFLLWGRIAKAVETKKIVSITFSKGLTRMCTSDFCEGIPEELTWNKLIVNTFIDKLRCVLVWPAVLSGIEALCADFGYKFYSSSSSNEKLSLYFKWSS